MKEQLNRKRSGAGWGAADANVLWERVGHGSGNDGRQVMLGQKGDWGRGRGHCADTQ